MQTLRMAPVLREDDGEGPPDPKGALAAAGQPESLPAALSSALAEFCRYLAAERALSRHTVRAYQGDILALLEHAWRCGVGDPGSLERPTQLRHSACRRAELTNTRLRAAVITNDLATRMNRTAMAQQRRRSQLVILHRSRYRVH